MIYLANIDLNQNELQNAIIQPLAVAPPNPRLGQIYTNSTTNRLMLWDNSSWKVVGVTVESSSTNGNIIVDGVEMSVYTLPLASDTTLGGVKVGAGLSIDATGTLVSTPAWSDITEKPPLIGAGLFESAVSSVAQLKEAVHDAVQAGTLEEHGIYHGELSSFNDGNGFTGNVEYTIIVQSSPFPIILFWSMNGYDGFINRAWFCYATSEEEVYTNAVYKLTNEPGTVIDANYVHTANNFTTELLDKLNNIQAGAEINVQSDWNQTDTTADNYILHKPTALSEFANDQEFINNTTNNLTNYYLKSETYSQVEVNTLIGNLHTIEIEVVTELPVTGSSNIIYLLPASPSQPINEYDEYIWISSTSNFEKIGNTAIDLTNYLQVDGNASNTTVNFQQVAERTLPVTGESLSTILAKIVNYLTDLKAVAFSNSYDDLSNRPNKINVVQGILLSPATNLHIVAPGLTASDKIVNVIAIDDTTREPIMLDWYYDALTSKIIVSTTEGYSHDILINVSYITN